MIYNFYKHNNKSIVVLKLIIIIKNMNKRFCMFKGFSAKNVKNANIFEGFKFVIEELANQRASRDFDSHHIFLDANFAIHRDATTETIFETVPSHSIIVQPTKLLLIKF